MTIHKGTAETVHQKAFRAFCDHCWWIHEVRSALGVMCNHAYLNSSISGHMRIVVQSMQAHYFLQVSMLFDKKKNRHQDNLVLDSIINDFCFSNQTIEALQELKKKMLPFANRIKKYRNKMGAHFDYQHAVHKRNRRLGKFNQEDERVFFESLLEFMRVADVALNQVTGIDWTTSNREDAEYFMKILIDAGVATPDQVVANI